MIDLILAILCLLLVALFVALIVGLIKPAKVLLWDKKPNRWKVFGWYMLSSMVVCVLLGIITPTTSEDHIQYAKEYIAEGNYGDAISELKEIPQDDSLYAEAQILIARTESLQKAGVVQETEKNEIKTAEIKQQPSESDASKTTTATIKPIIKNPSEITSVEDAKAFIKGKIFTAVKARGLDGQYYKIACSDDSFTLWCAYPSDNEWGSPRYRGKYEIKQGKYTDTGNSYYILLFTPDNQSNSLKCLAFNISVLSFLDCYGNVAKSVEGNINTWN